MISNWKLSKKLKDGAKEKLGAKLSLPNFINTSPKGNQIVYFIVREKIKIDKQKGVSHITLLLLDYLVNSHLYVIPRYGNLVNLCKGFLFTYTVPVRG